MYLLSYRKSQSDYFILIHFITNQPIMQIKKSFYNCFVEDKTKENNKYGKCYYHLKMWMSVCVTWSLVASLKNVHNIAPLSI